MDYDEDNFNCFLTWDYVKLYFHLLIKNPDIVYSVGQRLRCNERWETEEFIWEAEKKAHCCLQILLLTYCFLHKHVDVLHLLY